MIYLFVIILVSIGSSERCSLEGLYSPILYGGVHGTSSGIGFDLSVFHFSDLCGRYGPFYGVKDRSNRADTVTGRQIWTDP